MPNNAKPLTATEPAVPVLLLTRPADAAARFAAQIAAQGIVADVVVSPVMEIVDLHPPQPQGPVAGVIVTSENGARALARLDLARVPVWAVGARTAAATGRDATVAGPDAAGLIARLVADRVAGPLLHLRGHHAVTDLAARLTALGIPTHDLVVYDQRACPLSAQALAALNGRRPVILPVFSPRSAALIAGHGPFAAPLHIVAISAATAAPLAPFHPVTLTLAETPDGAAMQRATAAAIGRVAAG